MRVTGKGQVTIPLPVRGGLGIKPGTEVEIELRDGEAVLRKLQRDGGQQERHVADFIAHVRSFKGSVDLGGLAVDEVMALLRD